VSEEKLGDFEMAVGDGIVNLEHGAAGKEEIANFAAAGVPSPTTANPPLPWPPSAIIRKSSRCSGRFPHPDADANY
jgi:hypothetical protein